MALLIKDKETGLFLLQEKIPEVLLEFVPIT